MHLGIVSKDSGMLRFDDVKNRRHIQHNHGNVVWCCRVTRLRQPWQTTKKCRLCSCQKLYFSRQGRWLTLVLVVEEIYVGLILLVGIETAWWQVLRWILLIPPFFRSIGSLLLKMYILALGMTSKRGSDAFSILSSMNSVHVVLPMLGASLKHLAISGFMTLPVSNVIRSGPVSLNELIIVPSFTTFSGAWRSCRNLFCSAVEDSGCSMLKLFGERHSLFQIH